MKNLYKKLKETTPFLFSCTNIVLFLSYSQQKMNFNIFLLKICLLQRYMVLNL